MIVSISIQRPTGEQFLEVGKDLLNNEGKPLGWQVSKITYLFGTARVYFSNGEVGVFKGFPFVITKRK